jgi:hypothetical protein
MIGLRSQFGEALVVVFVVVAIAVAAGIVVARREYVRGGPWLQALMRVLAVGAVIATIVATALPRRLGIETDGDLVLRLGRGGLNDWRILFRDPLSLASIELVANVLLYAGVAFTMVLGWSERRRIVVPACVALSVLIELAQWLVLGRVGTLDDVVLNGAGAIVGYALASALLRTRTFARGFG